MRFALAALALASAVSAQLISPVGFDTLGGNSSNSSPFYGISFRCQQVHGDLVGQSLSIKGLSFRRDAIWSSAARKKRLSLTVWLGQGSFSNVSKTFAKNYDTSGPSNVLPLSTVQLPQLPFKPANPPAPFTVHVPFQKPYVYAGKRALVWDMIGSATLSQGWSPYPLDADKADGPRRGVYVELGTGCMTAGHRSPMLAVAYFTTLRNPDRKRYICHTQFATKNAPAMMFIGLTNPNVPFPICNKTLYTDASLASIPLRSDWMGTFQWQIDTPWHPQWAGRRFYTQTATADPTKFPMPIAVSNGAMSIVPTLGVNQGKTARVLSYLSGGSATGVLDMGYAVITRFDK